MDSTQCAARERNASGGKDTEKGGNGYEKREATIKGSNLLFVFFYLNVRFLRDYLNGFSKIKYKNKYMICVFLYF